MPNGQPRKRWMFCFLISLKKVLWCGSLPLGWTSFTPRPNGRLVPCISSYKCGKKKLKKNRGKIESTNESRRRKGPLSRPFLLLPPSVENSTSSCLYPFVWGTFSALPVPSPVPTKRYRGVNELPTYPPLRLRMTCRLGKKKRRKIHPPSTIETIFSFPYFLTLPV